MNLPHCILENGLFWIALILLSLGAITTFHYQEQGVIKTVSPHVYQYPDAAKTGADKVLTIYDEDTEKPRVIILPDDAGAK